MSHHNPKIERSALLLSADSATLGLQIARMVKEAVSPARRAFFVADELAEWLAPLLADDERAARAAFLAAPPSA